MKLQYLKFEIWINIWKTTKITKKCLKLECNEMKKKKKKLFYLFQSYIIYY